MVQALSMRSTLHARPNLGGPLHQALWWLNGELSAEGFLLAGEEVPPITVWQYLLDLPRGEVRPAIEDLYPHHMAVYQAADHLSQSWIFASIERLVDLLRDLRPNRILVEPEVPAMMRGAEFGAKWHRLAPDLAVDGDTEDGWTVIEVKTGTRPARPRSGKMYRYLIGTALHTHVHYPECWRVAKCIWISFATHDAKGRPSPGEPVVNMDMLRFDIGRVDAWCQKEFGCGLKGLFRLEEKARSRGFVRGA